MMQRLSSLLVKTAAFGLVAMTLIVGWQVFGRFILANSPSWTEQAALIIMIWFVLLASASGVYEGFHIRIGLLEGARPRIARPVRIFFNAVVALLGLVIAIYGAELAWAVRSHTVPSLGISRGFAYLPLPVCGAIMTVFACVRAAGPSASETHEEE